MQRPLLILALALSLAACKAKTNGGAPAAAGPIRIGFSAPLTGSEAQIGQDQRDGSLLAVEEANKAGGVLGRQIELVERDDKADPKEAASVAKFFTSDASIVAVAAHLNSDCSITGGRIYHQANLAMVSPSSTSDALTEQGFKSAFRLALPNSMQGSEAAKFAVARGWRKIVILDDGGAFGEGIAGEFEKALRASGAQTEILWRDRVGKDDTDFRPVLAKIRDSGADGVYYGGMYPAAGLLLRQSEELGLTFSLLGGDGLRAPKLIELAGPASERAYMTFIAPLRADLDAAPPFYRSFKERFGRLPVVYAPLGYDAVNVILEAIRRAGKTDRDAITAALHAPDFRWEGVTGAIHFDEKGGGVDRKAYFYGVRGGDFVLLETDKPG